MPPAANLPDQTGTTADRSLIEPSRSLAISRQLRDEMLEHLRAAMPNEGCGLLATIRTDDGAETGVHFFPGANVDAVPYRFTMDPRQVIDAIKSIRQEGWRLGAIVHSHPTSQPVPSATDLHEAYYPDALLLIFSFMCAIPDARAWRVRTSSTGNTFEERPVVILEN